MALGLLAGCDDAAGPEIGRIAITPPDLYATWWGEMQSCSELSRDPDGVSWFVTYEFPGGASILGQWNSRREITLRSDLWLDREVVGHEILHDLLDGDPDHGDLAWERCQIPVGVDGR